MLGADGNKPTGKPGQRKRKGESKKAEARKRKTVQEAAQPQQLPSDQLQDTAETVGVPVTSIEDAPIGAPSLETLSVDTSLLEATTADKAVSAAEASPVETPAAASISATPEGVGAAIFAAEMSPAGLATIDWSPAAAADVAPVPSAEPAPAAPAEILQSTAAETSPVCYQTIANAYGDLTRRSLDQTTSFFEKFWGVRSLDKAFELQTEFAKQAYDNFVAEAQKIRELHHELSRQRLQRWEGFVGIAKPR